ncbi:putative carboxylesterase family protein [Paratrimastix pyriformis]|uniref:Carboxylesterase family protein n=1 Tax=Paratrimastix pyriformis TaxID=342808 RepID=A0ABQ8U7Z7_9EUKA|nr:putative carboxylesterase family protein [Paratrimastix pyriformis]
MFTSLPSQSLIDDAEIPMVEHSRRIDKKTQKICLIGWLVALLFCLATIAELVVIVCFVRVPPERLRRVIVSVQSGPVQGYQSTRSREFLGIPFAQPPVGALRWKAPQEPTPWTQTLVASHFQKACMQPLSATVPDVSEDCLYLNVFTPTEERLKYHAADGDPAHAKLPVLVFIHGGSGRTGSASQGIPTLFNGTNLAAAHGSVVVVTFNYRLGPFGFLATDSLAAEGSATVGQYAALDQAAALRWVHTNIANFGGNPEAVTLVGQSAGGAYALDMLVRQQPAALGNVSTYFQRVISLSGASSYPGFYSSLTVATALGAAVAAEMGCPEGGLACMRAIDAATVMKAFTARAPPGVIAQPIDGATLPAHPLQLIRQGRYNSNVPVRPAPCTRPACTRPACPRPACPRPARPRPACPRPSPLGAMAGACGLISGGGGWAVVAGRRRVLQVVLGFVRAESLGYFHGVAFMQKPVPRAAFTEAFLGSLNDTAAALSSLPIGLLKPGATLDGLFSTDSPYMPASQPSPAHSRVCAPVGLCENYRDGTTRELSDDCRPLVTDMIAGDWAGRCSVRHTALALSATGKRAPLWMFEFAESVLCPAVPGSLLPELASAPAHSDELPYFFNTISSDSCADPALAKCKTSPQQFGAGIFLRDFTACFSDTGSPEGCENPAMHWPQWTPEREDHLVLSRASRVARAEMALACDWWENRLNYA